MEYFSLLNSLLCNGCEISAQNTKAGAHFTFTLSRKCHLFFCTNKGCWCLLMEIHLYIFRKPFTLKLCSSVFFFLLLSMSSGDTDYQRLSSVSGRAPRGPLSLFCAGTQSQCRGWGLFQVLSSFPTSNCMHRFKKKKKQAMKARWLRRQHCEVNIFHGAERMVEK